MAKLKLSAPVDQVGLWSKPNIYGWPNCLSHVMRSSGQTLVKTKNLLPSRCHSKHLLHDHHHHHLHHHLFLKVALYKALSFFDVQYCVSHVFTNTARIIWLERVIHGIEVEVLAPCPITLLFSLTGSLFYWQSPVSGERRCTEREKTDVVDKFSCCGTHEERCIGIKDGVDLCFCPGNILFGKQKDWFRRFTLQMYKQTTGTKCSMFLVHLGDSLHINESINLLIFIVLSWNYGK